MPYRKEENWRISFQREDGQNNDYYIFPKEKQAFWALAEKHGGIILRFISKFAQELPRKKHLITSSPIPHITDVSTFIRNSTIENRYISKLFQDSIIVAVPKGAEEALEYRLFDFNHENETTRVEKEINLNRPFQEPIGPEPKPRCSSVASHIIYIRDPRKKANAIRKANFLCEISNSHKLFKSRITNQNYVEAHHLIPLKQGANFPFSLDIEANIVVLCPYCHRMLHHGKKEEIRSLLDLLFQKRKDLLSAKGIKLTLNQLCSYYGFTE